MDATLSFGLTGLRYHDLANEAARVESAMQEFAEFAQQFDRPMEEKIRAFQRQGRLKHLIFGSQLTPELIDKLCRSADIIRRMSKDRDGNQRLRQILADKRAMLYFTQPSTRTFLSFMAACQILGVTCNEVRNPETSSEIKRESRMDSIRMFSSYFDVIIMRSLVANFAECCAYMMNVLENQEMRSVPVINAGAGSDEHPTQALLDVYTILRTFNFDEGSISRVSRFETLREKYPKLTTGPGHKTYVFCGDIGRGRTVRSLASVLAQYPDIQMIFVSPDHEVLKLDHLLKARLLASGVRIHEFETLDADLDGTPILENADCVYMTRIQREHNEGEQGEQIAKLDLSPFKLTVERVSRMKDYAPIMHPFPRDSVVGEIPTQIDADPRAMYFRQARNGMWVRAALLVHLFDVVDELFAAYSGVS